MARPLRLEYPGALFHLTCRGNEKRPTFLDDYDRRLFLDLLRDAVHRYGWIVSAYVLMTNHYHVLLELTVESLSRGAQWLNGKYGAAFNRRHDRVGHLFQGRPDARLIQKQVYYLNVLRYTVLNPVRAQMVRDPAAYEWSSCRATAGLAPVPEWLACGEVLRHFAPEPSVAQALYRSFVRDGVGKAEKPWDELVGGMYLGTPAWLEQVRARVESRPRDAEHPRAQRRLRGWHIHDVIVAVAMAFGIHVDLVRNDRGGTSRMLVAWLGANECLLTLSAIAAGLRVRSEGYVSRLVRKCDEQLDKDATLRTQLDRCLALLYQS